MSKPNEIVKELIESEYPLSTYDLEKSDSLADAYKKKIQWWIDYRQKDVDELLRKIKGLESLRDSCDEIFAEAA